jgi:hypothetical protein
MFADAGPKAVVYDAAFEEELPDPSDVEPVAGHALLRR